MEGDLPGVAVNTLVCDTSGTGGLYAGTDMGVYYWSNADSLWIDYSEGLPLTVRVTELELYAGNGPNDPRRIVPEPMVEACGKQTHKERPKVFLLLRISFLHLERPLFMGRHRCPLHSDETCWTFPWNHLSLKTST